MLIISSATKICWSCRPCSGAPTPERRIALWNHRYLVGLKLIKEPRNRLDQTLLKIHAPTKDLNGVEMILEILNIPGYASGRKYTPVLTPWENSPFPIYWWRSLASGMYGDQQAALWTVTWKPGMAKILMVLIFHHHEYRWRDAAIWKITKLTTIGYGINVVYYALEGSIFIAGSAIQWLLWWLQENSPTSNNKSALHNNTLCCVWYRPSQV